MAIVQEAIVPINQQKLLHMNTKVLDTEIVINNLPETAEEFDTLAGRAGACVEAAVQQVLYHRYFATLRPAVAEALEKESKFARHFELKGDEENAVKIYENDKAYVGRLRQAIEDGEVDFTEEDIAATVQATVDSLPVNFKPAVRGTGLGSKPAKKWMETAAAIMSSEESLANFFTKLIGEFIPKKWFTGQVFDAESSDLDVRIALAVKEVTAAKEEELRKSILL